MFVLSQERIEKTGWAGILPQLAVFQEHVNCFPQRVIENFYRLLIDEGVISDGGKVEGHGVPCTRRIQRGFHLGIALGRSKSHHHVFGPHQSAKPKGEFSGNIERRKRPLADDHGMHELNRHMLRVRGRGATPEG